MSPPITFLGILIILVFFYILLVELMKIIFYNRYGTRVEQVVITKKKTDYYVNKTTMVIHSMVVLISLYPMDFVSLDKFFMDLK